MARVGVVVLVLKNSAYTFLHSWSISMTINRHIATHTHWTDFEFTLLMYMSIFIYMDFWAQVIGIHC